MRFFRRTFLWLVSLGLVCGCSGTVPPETSPETPTSPAVLAITLATTTSARDSGLLNVLLPVFERQDGIQVKVVAVGSGQALELGRRGDADLLLTHSPDDEKKFVEDGWGLNRRPLMHNDFIIVGPADDPAGIKSSKTAADALRTIAEKQGVFVSRGDESGTHKKEQAVWKAAGIKPQGDWYVSSGTGMALSLRMAHEKRGYILTDRGTFLSTGKEIDLVIDYEGDPLLLNKYSVMVVNPARHPHVHNAEAMKCADFLVSPTGQGIIRTFGVEKYGQPLFVPDAGDSGSR